MEYRPLGKSELEVSPICLGTMMFGGVTDGTEAGRIIASARDAGVNFIDTADMYNKGESETVTGRLIAPDRTRWVLASKGGHQWSDNPAESGNSYRWLRQAITNSLKRLGTDYVDIYYLHKDDRGTPLEETLLAIGDFIREGKARYFGVSNFAAWRIAQIVHLCDQLGVSRPVAAQPLYNAMSRQSEVEYLPACQHYGLGVVAYSPLARGVLTGKYLPGQPPPVGSRTGRKDRNILLTEYRTESLEFTQCIKQRAAARGMLAMQFAYRWVLNNRVVTAAIAGPRTEQQWESYVRALDHHLTAEDEAFVDNLVHPGHSSTPGYTDPRYPVTGRPPLSDADPQAAP